LCSSVVIIIAIIIAKGIHFGHTPALDCAGMIVPGAIVYCTLSTGDTKTKYKVQFCEEERENGTQAQVACHPNLAEKVAKELLKDNHLTKELGVYNGENVLGQQTFGKSRVDFVIQHDDNSITLVEVKNVVGADYIEGAVPVARYCMYVCMHVCMHVCIQLNIFMYMYEYVYMNACDLFKICMKNSMCSHIYHMFNPHHIKHVLQE
jgi:hypothetical protein